MAGVPVWLASLSRRSPIDGELVATGRWSSREIEEGLGLLRSAVLGAGDPTRERIFRMNVTLCLHRALRDDETLRLGVPFSPALCTNLAGPPVAILWESVEGSASTRPCANPKHGIADPRRPDLWIPVGCGACESCQARAELIAQREEGQCPEQVPIS